MPWLRLIVTSTLKSALAIRAHSRIASCTGLPSVTPQTALGWPTISALCSSITVSMPASPGAIILGPPLNPAKKCGSTNPVVILTSLSVQIRFRATGIPFDVWPTSARPARSNASWFMTR